MTPLINPLNVAQGAGEENVKRYSPERKEAVLKKLAPPYNLSVPELSQQEGISVGALYNWRSQARLRGAPVPGPSKTSDDWSTQAKFAVVVETATLSEAELSQYCREKGLYPMRCAGGLKFTSRKPAKARFFKRAKPPLQCLYCIDAPDRPEVLHVTACQARRRRGKA